MAHVTYTELRQNLARYMNEAVDSAAPIFSAATARRAMW
jgi:hypothetical protein